MDEYREAPARQRIGEGAAAIVGAAKRLHCIRRSIRTIGNLLFAEELVVTVIVECDDAWETCCTGRFEEQSLSAWPEADRPGQQFAFQAIAAPAAQNLHICCLTDVEREAE